MGAGRIVLAWLCSLACVLTHEAWGGASLTAIVALAFVGFSGAPRGRVGVTARGAEVDPTRRGRFGHAGPFGPGLVGAAAALGPLALAFGLDRAGSTPADQAELVKTTVFALVAIVLLTDAADRAACQRGSAARYGLLWLGLVCAAPLLALFARTAASAAPHAIWPLFEAASPLGWLLAQARGAPGSAPFAAFALVLLLWLLSLPGSPE